MATTTRADIGEMLARRFEPKAWAEYDDGDGICSHDAGTKCLMSFDLAARILPVMEFLNPSLDALKEALDRAPVKIETEGS